MAFLNSIVNLLGSNALVTPLVAAPGKMWHVLILKAFGWIGDYGWSIVVFTVLLKLVLSPLDFFQRYKMRKNQKITERLKPTMEKIQKQYGNDKQAFAQKQMELNRREGYSYFSSCLPMIVTMVVFITLWLSMTTVGRYMTLKEYTTLYDGYNVSYQQVMEETGDAAGAKAAYDAKYVSYTDTVPDNEKDLSDEEKTKRAEERRKAAAQDEYDKVINDTGNKTLATAVGKDVVFTMYYDGISESYVSKLRTDMGLSDDFKLEESKKVQSDFLWIKNIWAPDVPWGSKAILTYKDFVSAIGDYADADKNHIPDSMRADLLKSESKYNTVMEKLLNDKTHSRTNGYLLLPIFVVLLSVASQLISSLQQKRAGQINAKGGMATSMKVMMFIMPVMMAIFAIQYASIFTLYMVTNTATTLVFNFLFTGMINLFDRHKKNRNYGISTGSPRTINYQKSPIIHYVKGANPEAGKKEAPVVADTVDAAPVSGGKKSKKDKNANTVSVVRSGRPDPNELMNYDMGNKGKKKK